MKKIIMLFVAIVGLSLNINQSLMAQEQPIANKLYHTEFGGPGLIMSANFDSRFKSNTRLGFGYRLGAGFGVKKFDERLNDPNTGNTYYEKIPRTVYAIPIGLNYVFGNSNSNSAFEVGGGVSLLSRKVSLFNYEVKKRGHMIGYVAFMYRIVPANGGFSFRAGFTPIIGTAGDMFPMGAVGFGYAF